ncbi:tRNA-specific adenosine deaminase [Gammaproteobacteria bacterium MOLA455]|nr:tRNA-specific adenosine deaminase [Gammaproteobacteria bacterium MOLA455]
MSVEEDFMSRALVLAQQAAAAGEVPVGALVVKGGEVIGEGYNQPITSCDPTGHAEIIALRNAATALGNYRLSGCDLYVTIEPCTMCVGAMVHARIGRIIFGAREPRAGALESQLRLMDESHYNHSIEWQGGVLADECGAIMSGFFRAKRAAGKALKL